MSVITKRARLLRLAILNILQEGPVHGYAVRKHLNSSLGTFKTLSYGSLYPALRKLETEGVIASSEERSEDSIRKRVVYSITEKGSNYLSDELSTVQPKDWEDENFSVRFQLFSETDILSRVQILEGRYNSLQKRIESMKSWADIASKKSDPYVQELAKHTLQQAKNEVEWLSGLLVKEKSNL